MLVAEGWRVYRVEGLQFMARHGRSAGADVRPEEQIGWLEAAARLAPENAQVHLELARAHLRRVHIQKEQRVQRLLARETAQAALALLPAGVPAHAAHSVLVGLPSWLVVVSARHVLLSGDEEALGQALVPALRAALRARDTGPLLTGPHLELASHRNALAVADPPLTYLGRAKFLAPADPDLWYFCGLQDLLWLQPRQACADWRQSLQLSPRNLQRILDASAAIFTAEEILEQIIPERPGQLLSAMSRLIPEEDTTRRMPVLEKALILLERQQPPLQAQDLHDKAVIHTALKQLQRAAEAYQAALDQEPRRVDWRFEYAQVLHAQVRLQETRRELLQVLDNQASHGEARALLLIVTREIAETR
jgi:tetratricopeptide (TPR) repeat protein